MLQVQQRMCATCIYRKDSSLNIKELERQIADPFMKGYFKGARLCHHAPDRAKVVCKGFWDRHKDKFTAGQLAQRLKCVVFVNIDRFKKKTAAKRHR